MGITLHQNSKGIKMVRDDFRFRSQVKVISENAGKRYTLRTYRFDNIHEPVEIPYCSWANLDCCGGWSCDEEYLDTAVQNGSKLFAGRATTLKHQYSPNAPTLEDARRQFEAFKKTIPAGVFADEESERPSSDWFYTFICREGTISDYIDLDAVFYFYDKLGQIISSAEKEEIERFCSCEIKQYGTSRAFFQYAHAATKTELVATGLLLGYPIESTVSILQGY